MDMSEAAATGAFIHLIKKGDRLTMGDLYEFMEIYEPDLLDTPMGDMAFEMNRLCAKYLARTMDLFAVNPILGAWSE